MASSLERRVDGFDAPGSRGGAQRAPRSHGSAGRGAVAAAVAGLAVVGLASGCASTRVSNLDAYPEVPMNRVAPYPSDEELRKRAYEVIIVDRPSPGIDEAQIRKARARVRRALEGLAAEAGAAVIDRSLQEIGELETEEVLRELGGESGEELTGADFALATRFGTHRYTSEWKKPFKFVWQDPVDVEGKPGTCTHRAEVEIDVQVIEVGSNDRAKKTYALAHSAEQKNKDLDSACGIAPTSVTALFEKAIDEAIGCLRVPLGRELSPRGHLTAHRKAADADRHIYRISLGSAHGLEKGDRVEIRREQRATSPTGEETRTERVIAGGEVTDQVNVQSAWVAIDPAKASDQLLDGDVVRPVFEEGLLSSLSGPDCEEILKER